MKALILGERIIQIEAVEFPVASPLYWVDVPNDTTTMDTWDGTQVVKHTEPIISQQEIRQPAVSLIQNLQRELALAELATDQPEQNRIKREISRIKFMSPGV